MRICDIVNPSAAKWYERAKYLYGVYGMASLDQVQQLALQCGLSEEDASRKAKSYHNIIQMIGANAAQSAKENLFVDWLQVCMHNKQHARPLYQQALTRSILHVFSRRSACEDARYAPSLYILYITTFHLFHLVTHTPACAQITPRDLDFIENIT